MNVSTVKTIRVLPHQSIVIEVKTQPSDGPVLLEHDCALEESTGLQLEDTLVFPSKEGFVYAIISREKGRKATGLAVNVSTVKTIRVLPHQSIVIEVKTQPRYKKVRGQSEAAS